MRSFIEVLFVGCCLCYFVGCGDEMMYLLTGQNLGSEERSQTPEIADEVDPPVDSVTSGNAICEMPLVASEGSRFISITPQGIGSEKVAFRVTSPDFAGVDAFVDESGLLSCRAVFRTVEEWGTIHVGDSLIVPEANYRVESHCENGSISSETMVSTWKWGDANNDNVIDIDDILCALGGFSGHFTYCTFQALDQEKADPDRVIQLDDLLAVLVAFSGGSYAHELPPSDPAALLEIASPILLKLSTFVDGCCLSNRKGPFPPDLCGVEIHEDRG